MLNRFVFSSSIYSKSFTLANFRDRFWFFFFSWFFAFSNNENNNKQRANNPHGLVHFNPNLLARLNERNWMRKKKKTLCSSFMLREPQRRSGKVLLWNIEALAWTSGISAYNIKTIISGHGKEKIKVKELSREPDVHLHKHTSDGLHWMEPMLCLPLPRLSLTSRS